MWRRILAILLLLACEAQAAGVYTEADETTQLVCLRAEDGTRLTDYIYSDVIPCGNGWILCRDGKYGAVNGALEELVPFEYTYLAARGTDEYLALKSEIYDELPDELYYINRNGYCAATGVTLFYAVPALDSPEEAYLSAETGRWGYLDFTGQWRIAPEYIAAGSFVDGMAAVYTEEGAGVINFNGDYIIEPEYSQICLNGVAIVGLKDGVADVFTRDSEGCALLGEYAARYACLNADMVTLYGTEVVELSICDCED